MRRFLLCVALLASVRTSAAESNNFLFVSVASAQRVDAYRVYDDGTLSANPVVQRVTKGVRPRRIISNGCNLYVAEANRTEVFRIHAGGVLEPIGATRQSKRVRAHDIKLSPDGTALYEPLRNEAAIAVFPLGANGAPSLDVKLEDGLMTGKPTGCIYGPPQALWEDFAVDNDKLYAAFADRVEVYGIVPGLHCSNVLTRACTTASTEITGSSECIVAGDCFEGTCFKKPLYPLDPVSPDFTIYNINNKTCTTDADCQGFCASSQLTGAAIVPEDRTNNCEGTDDPDLQDPKDRCAPLSTTPANILAPCFEPEKDTEPGAPKPLTRQERETCGFSSRNNLAGGVGLAVQGTTLVVVEGFNYAQRLQGFTLQDDGNFQPIPMPPDPDNPNPTCVTKTQNRNERKTRKNNRTNETIRYIGLTLFDPPNPDKNPIIFAAGYKGRTDAFRLELNDEGVLRLPKDLSSSTPFDRTATPVRSAIGSKADGSPMLYVAPGELDRIQAFALQPDGSFDPHPKAEKTNELSGSFPNDVLFKDITGCD